MKTAGPLLSVVTITYNHEEFIAKTIDGILMQKVDFQIEFIIAEDCSTDSTRSIINKYKDQHTSLIELISSEYNVGAVKNESRALLQSKGKYIAICEGDDYWTDPYKLQKQVEFLESHQDYSVCFHRYKILEDELNQYRNDNCEFLFADSPKEGVNIDTELFLKHWITQPVTMVFRRRCFDMTLIGQYKHFRDMHLIYHLLQKGKGYLFSFDGAVYREHSGGIHGKQSEEFQCKIGVAVAKELFIFNKTELLKENYLRNLNWAIGYFKQNKGLNKELIGYIIDYYLTSHSLSTLAKHILKWK